MLFECPVDVIETVVKHLDSDTTINLANTCQDFRRIVSGCAQYWQERCNRKWDLTIRSMLDLDLFITAKIRNDILGFSPMRRYLLLKLI
jgi:hypothetical protein